MNFKTNTTLKEIAYNNGDNYDEFYLDSYKIST